MSLYFAYGANMSRHVIAGRRGLRVVACERARLVDHRFAFAQRGVPYIEPAFATVLPATGEVVHGVLWTLEGEPDLAQLDRNESPGYDRVLCEVEGESMGRAQAHVYRTRRPHENLVPSRRYRDLIVDGAREHALPEAWIARIASHPVSSFSVPKGVIRFFDRVRKRG